MCSFRVREHICGHYDKTFNNPCKDAKRKKEACEIGTTDDTSTSGSPNCGNSGCDRKRNLKREGPGSRRNGDFDEDDINWDDYRGN
ncbi:hypothetical protein ACJ72_02405 [Emergomyces africanus]|uniref:Uncharacterized protein n=1 Tax=Emergomyces africanus TaxID=1955775 RepID=A0A1B7P2Z5_9EURO|nr:hypothetical protein ACJ72_02405 [Emergomyces africanus]